MNVRRINLTLGVVLLIIGAAILLPTTPAQTGTQAEPKIVRKSAEELRGSAVTRVEPIYPPLAKAAGVGGEVIVEITVDENGGVEQANVVSGHALLKDAVAAAARGWKFTPTLLSGVPVKVIGNLAFSFSPPTAQLSESSGNDEEIEEAKKAVAANSSSAEAHFRLAEAYSDDDQYEKTLEPYNRAIELKPAYKEAYLGLALAYEELQRPDERIATYKRAITALPKDVQLLQAAAAILNEAQRLAEAIDVYKSIVQLKPDDAGVHMSLGYALFRARRFPEAIAAYQEAIRIQPKNGLAYHNIGAAYLNQRRYEDAIAAYENALTAEPNYSQAYKVHVEMGRALLISRWPDEVNEALEEFKKAIQLNPRYAQAHIELGSAYHALTRYSDASDSMKQAIALQPRNGVSHSLLGEAYLHLSRDSEAEKELREAVSVDPKGVQGLVMLATLLFAQQKLDEAEKLVQEANRHAAKGSPTAYLFVSNQLQHLGKNDVAEAALKKVLQVEPNNAMALNNLGYILVERNERLEEALEMIKRALAADPKNGAFLDSLGWAYFKLNKLDEAERHLMEAAQFRTSPVVFDHLGDTFMKRGKPEQARDIWQKALRLSPGSELSAKIRAKLDALNAK